MIAHNRPRAVRSSWAALAVTLLWGLSSAASAQVSPVLRAVVASRYASSYTADFDATALLSLVSLDQGGTLYYETGDGSKELYRTLEGARFVDYGLVPGDAVYAWTDTWLYPSSNGPAGCNAEAGTETYRCFRNGTFIARRGSGPSNPPHVLMDGFDSAKDPTTGSDIANAWLADNGDLLWTKSGQLYRRRANVTSAVDLGGLSATSLFSDGVNILFSTTATYGFVGDYYVHNDAGTSLLVADLANDHPSDPTWVPASWPFLLTGGWVAYTRKIDGYFSVFVRAPDGTIRQASVPSADLVATGLSPDGALSVTSGGRQYILQQGKPALDVCAETFGPLRYRRGWAVLAGRSVYTVQIPDELPTPTARSPSWVGLDTDSDAGVPSSDAGTFSDAGATSDDDAGATSDDAGAPSSDAGAVAHDAGSSGMDGGAMSPEDGGASTSDPGGPLDAGVVATIDADSPQTDGSSADDVDAGARPTSPVKRVEHAGGCSAMAEPTHAAGPTQALLLMLLFALRQRRRKSDANP